LAMDETGTDTMAIIIEASDRRDRALARAKILRKRRKDLPHKRRPVHALRCSCGKKFDQLSDAFDHMARFPSAPFSEAKSSPKLPPSHPDERL